MSNNMDLNYEMFCYQCEQTANGKGCTRLGVCGKTPEIAGLQDLLIFQVKGISYYGNRRLENGEEVEKDTIRFIEKVLFTTLTNVNFDADVHVELLRQSGQIKEELRERQVSVTAVCPGPVNTEFFQIAEQYGSTLEIKKLTMITSEQCVSEALYASYRKKDMVIPGIPMKAFAMLTKIVPQGLILKIAKMMKK